MIQIQSGIETLYSQERDWTCGIACLRTLLNATHRKSTPMSENEMVVREQEYNKTPGPRTAKDLKDLAEMFKLCKYILTKRDFSIDDITLYFKDYLIAVESKLHGGRWFVVTSIIVGSRTDCIQLYDPYYDMMLSFSLNQFYALWEDDKLLKGYREFIAVRRI